jgi:mannose-6-phosphate isomerase
VRINKPWGHEEWNFVGESYAFKKLFMLQGQSCSLQFHEEKHETVFVVSRRLNFEVGLTVDTLLTHQLSAGDSWTITPGTVHRMTAIVDTVYLEASTSQLDEPLGLFCRLHAVDISGWDVRFVA